MDSAIASLYFGINKYIINPAIIILFALAILVFVYGLVEFIVNKEDEKKQSAGKEHMKWGIVGLVIMAGAYGIFKLILTFVHSIG